MTTVFFYFSAAAHLIFSLWYSTSLSTTATSFGYEILLRPWHVDTDGFSGGLQIGIAAASLLVAANPSHHRDGLLASIALFYCATLYRLMALWLHGPVSDMSLAIGAIELALLAGAITLAWQQPST